MSSGFLLFCGSQYYPMGGWKDFEGEYATLEDALKAAANEGADWWHVVRGGAIVESGHRGLS